jgi:carboxylate-amine ligase
MVVNPERGVLAALGSNGGSVLGPLLASRASLQYGGAVVSLMTAARDTVAEAVCEAGMLRSELATALHERHGLAAAAAGLHPWSELLEPPALAPLRSRPATEVAGILGRFDPICGLRLQIAVPDADAATRALDGLRLHVPLLLALAANSPFWRGRFTGLASTRIALRATGSQSGLPRAFGSYLSYVLAVDALIQGGAIASPLSMAWDARLRPDAGAVEVTVMDSQTRIDDVAGLAALVQCVVRLHAERERERDDVIPELLLANRSAATHKGLRARLIDPAGHFTHPAADELAMLVDACAPIARELSCSRELAGLWRNTTDPGHARQRSITATAGLAGLVGELIRDFGGSPRPGDVRNGRGVVEQA